MLKDESSNIDERQKPVVNEGKAKASPQHMEVQNWKRWNRMNKRRLKS